MYTLGTGARAGVALQLPQGEVQGLDLVRQAAHRVDVKVLGQLELLELVTMRSSTVSALRQQVQRGSASSAQPGWEQSLSKTCGSRTSRMRVQGAVVGGSDSSAERSREVELEALRGRYA